MSGFRPLSNRPAQRPRHTATFSGDFQKLEDRQMLTVFTVDTLIDDASGLLDGQISFREAMIAAETNLAFGDAPAGAPNGDQIVFAGTLAGQTIDISPNGSFTITDDLKIGSTFNVTIDAAGQSGIFRFNGPESWSLQNLVLTNGNTPGRGGAVLLSGGGSLEMDRVQLKNNVAGNGGGAIFSNNSFFRIVSSRILYNEVQNENGTGGAILVSKGQANLIDSRVQYNFANASGGAIQVNDGTLLVTGSRLADNSVKNGNGGAIATRGFSQVTLDSSIVEFNEAGGSGGGVSLGNGGGHLVIRNDSIINANTATGTTALQGGGGIYNADGLVRILDSTVTSNQASGLFASGGGIFSVDGTVNVRRSEISSNHATVFGGGIEIVDGYLKLESSLLGGTTASEGNRTGIAGGVGDGGGIHVSGTNGTIIDIVDSDIDHNQATRDGGGIWLASNAILAVADSSGIRSNVANSAINGGGGIFNDGGSILIDNATFFGNLADGESSLGGAIQSVGGFLEISNTSFIFNIATRGGGGISLIDTRLNLLDSAISNGFATAGTGGGLFVSEQSVAVLDDSLISANTAESGGGIANYASRLILRNDSRVIGNRAEAVTTDTGMGGGIYSQSGLVRILDSAISDNRTLGPLAGEGGGIATLFGTLNLRQSRVVSNSAQTDGGGIFSRSGMVTIQDSIAGGAGPSDGNLAVNGAGMYFDGQTSAFVSGGEVTNNRASGNGGGVFNHPSSSLQIANAALFSSNVADIGGAIYNAGKLSLVDSALISNEATIGGGLGNQPAGIAVIDTANIDSNEATFVGGGIQNAGFLAFTDFGDVMNNSAGVTGGGVFTEGLAVTIVGDVNVSNNTPDDFNA